MTADVNENLDPTFYTHRPATSAEINEVIRRDGGDGIVVSRHECLARYPQIRELLAGARVRLPADPGDVREWADVMVMTGVLNAVERGLVEPGAEIVVHGSGTYDSADFTPVPDEHLLECPDAEALTLAVMAAAAEART